MPLVDERTHQAIVAQLNFCMGRREIEMLRIIEQNPDKCTRDVKQLLFEAGYGKAFKHEFSKSVKEPYLELQQKGLIFGISKGGRAKYWKVTQLGRQILEYRNCNVIEESVDYGEVTKASQNQSEKNEIHNDVKEGIIMMRDMLRTIVGDKRWTDEIEPQLPKRLRHQYEFCGRDFKPYQSVNNLQPVNNVVDISL